MNKLKITLMAAVIFCAFSANAFAKNTPNTPNTPNTLNTPNTPNTPNSYVDFPFFKFNPISNDFWLSYSVESIACPNGEDAPNGDILECVYYVRLPVYQGKDLWEDTVYLGNSYGVFNKAVVCGQIFGDFSEAQPVAADGPNCSAIVQWQ